MLSTAILVLLGSSLVVAVDQSLPQFQPEVAQVQSSQSTGLRRASATTGLSGDLPVCKAGRSTELRSLLTLRLARLSD